MYMATHTQLNPVNTEHLYMSGTVGGSQIIKTQESLSCFFRDNCPLKYLIIGQSGELKSIIHGRSRRTCKDGGRYVTTFRLLNDSTKKKGLYLCEVTPGHVTKKEHILPVSVKRNSQIRALVLVQPRERVLNFHFWPRQINRDQSYLPYCLKH